MNDTAPQSPDGGTPKTMPVHGTDTVPEVRVFKAAAAGLDGSSGALLLVGLAVIFAGTGSLNIGSFSMELGRDAPTYVKASAVALGILLSLMAAYMIARPNIRQDDLGLFRYAFSLMSCLVIAMATFSILNDSVSESVVSEWGYNPQERRAFMNYDSALLSKREGKSLVLVVKREQPTENGDDLYDFKIESDWRPFMGPTEISLNCSETLAKNVRLGDKLFFYLYTVPKGTRRESIKSLNDISTCGTMLTYRWLRVALKKPEPAELLVGYEQLSAPERRLMRELQAECDARLGQSTQPAK